MILLPQDSPAGTEEAVYAEETVGDIGYYHHMYRAYTGNQHCDPVANPAADDVGAAFDNSDIYTKGAWMLHALRNYIGEDAFWTGTRRLLYDTADPWSLAYPIESRYRSTADFIRIMSEEAGEDISWLVETYLREADMPELLTNRDGESLELEWSVPGDRVFPMPVEVSVNGELQVVDLSNGSARLAVPPNARLVVDPASKTLRALPIIGDCSEQAEAKVEERIERYKRMAAEYGWQRD